MSTREIGGSSTGGTDSSDRKPAGSDGPFRQDAYAVVIGIDTYQDEAISDLQCARADAQAVYDVLVDESLGRFNPDNIELLLDEAATAEAIKTAIATKLPRKAQEEDTVFIYYAGHGAPVINPGTPSRDGFEKYLVPVDAKIDNLRATGIPMADIQRYFGFIHSRQVLFFIDSCYSGAVGGRTFSQPDYSTRSAILSDEFLDQLAGSGRCIVTACGINEVSLESRGVGHGLFTYYLVEGLKGAADIDGDGRVTIRELYDYVYQHVKRESRKLNGNMRPAFKGSVEGRIYLTRCEPDAQKGSEKPAEVESKQLEREAPAKARQTRQEPIRGETHQGEVHKEVLAKPSKKHLILAVGITSVILFSLWLLVRMWDVMPEDSGDPTLISREDAQPVTDGLPAQNPPVTQVVAEEVLVPEEESLSYAFVIEPDPPDAQVKILNIGPSYQAGMLLEPGRYQVRVSRPGYQSKTLWLTVSDHDLTEVISIYPEYTAAIEPELVEPDLIEPVLSEQMGDISIRYMGDAANCILNISIHLENTDRVITPTTNPFPVYNISLVDNYYTIIGTISCPLLGASCNVQGEDGIDFLAGHTYDIMWEDAGYGVCDIALIHIPH